MGAPTKGGGGGPTYSLAKKWRKLHKMGSHPSNRPMFCINFAENVNVKFDIHWIRWICRDPEYCDHKRKSNFAPKNPVKVEYIKNFTLEEITKFEINVHVWFLLATSKRSLFNSSSDQNSTDTEIIHKILCLWQTVCIYLWICQIYDV